MTSASLLTWPHSDVRLDSAHGDNADLDEVRFNGKQQNTPSSLKGRLGQMAWRSRHRFTPTPGRLLRKHTTK
jgi:hypothetical protein